MGVTGESSEPVAKYLQDRYFCILPTSTVYCKGQKYVSKANEFRQVEEYLKSQGIECIKLIVASSIGADLAMAFLTSTKLPIGHVFFDGRQFAQIGKGVRRMMTPFLYLAIKSLYWSKGGTLKKILWCDDVIFVVLRYTQLDSVLDTLRANRTKNIVFVGNNVQTKTLAAALPEKNVLFAFALSAGHREADRVVSIDLKKITIGQLPGAASNKQLIGRIFHGTKYKVVYEPNMEDYLLCHAAFVMPAAFACYKTDGDLKKAPGRYRVPEPCAGCQHRGIPRHPRCRAHHSAQGGCRL